MDDRGEGVVAARAGLGDEPRVAATEMVAARSALRRWELMQGAHDAMML